MNIEKIATCVTCGGPALTTQQFLRAAKQLGFSVDRVTGAADYHTFPPVISSPLSLPQTEAEKQVEYNLVHGRRGFVCLACGTIHCASCLTGSPRSPVTGGPSCPSCAQGPHESLEG